MTWNSGSMVPGDGWQIVSTDAESEPVRIGSADIRADRELLLLASTEVGYHGTRVTAVPEPGRSA